VDPPHVGFVEQAERRWITLLGKEDRLVHGGEGRGVITLWDASGRPGVWVAWAAHPPIYSHRGFTIRSLGGVRIPFQRTQSWRAGCASRM